MTRSSASKQVSKAPSKKKGRWSAKRKRKVDCKNPKGFSQKAHCAGRKKRARRP